MVVVVSFGQPHSSRSIVTHDRACSCEASLRLLVPQSGATYVSERCLLVERGAGRKRSDARGWADFVLYALLLRRFKGGIHQHSTTASRKPCVKKASLCFLKSDKNRTGRLPPKRQDGIEVVISSMRERSPAGRRSLSIAMACDYNSEVNVESLVHPPSADSSRSSEYGTPRMPRMVLHHAIPAALGPLTSPAPRLSGSQAL